MGNHKPRSLENSDNVVDHHKTFKTAADFADLPLTSRKSSSDGLDLLSVHQPQKWMVATRFYNETQSRLTQVGPNSHISETNIAMYLQLLGMSRVPSGSSIPLQCAFFGTIAP
jgi:hypothetical protein